jgi:surface protein
MKKINYLLGSLFLVGALVFTACKKEEEVNEITKQVSDTVDEVKKYSLTVEASDNGTVEASSEGTEFEVGTEVTLTATANEGYIFSEWSNGSKENPLNVTINEDLIINAKFNIKIYSLTVEASDNGTVEASPEGVELETGTEVTLTATANEGYVFSKWSNGSTENPLTFTITEDIILETIFVLGNDYIVQDENGVTLKATDKAISGESYDLAGNTYYIAKDRADLEVKLGNEEDMSKIITTKVTSLLNLFQNSSFNQDISSWDVSNVTDMLATFSGNSSFNQDLSSWNVSNVTNMQATFKSANSFNQDLSSWDVSNVTNMIQMFFQNSGFNGDISTWQTGNVTSMLGMFQQCSNFNQDISGWNVSKVTDMREMLRACTVFNQDLSSWDLSSSPRIVNMLYDNGMSEENLCKLKSHEDYSSTWDDDSKVANATCVK